MSDSPSMPPSCLDQIQVTKQGLAGEKQQGRPKVPAECPGDRALCLACSCVCEGLCLTQREHTGRGWGLFILVLQICT